MDISTSKMLLAASGGGAAVDPGPLHAEDLFSTSLFNGNGGTQKITNGLDLSGEGGLVWVKSRSNSDGHRLVDTERSTTNKWLNINASNGETYTGNFLTPDSDGFTFTGANTGWNESNYEYCAWNFRKAPGFFDIQTWTGTGSDQMISHNLGSNPGSIWIKRTDSSSDWYVYHRSLPTANQNYIRTTTNSGANGAVGQDLWSSYASTFRADTYLGHSTVGASYVAYIFAHNAAEFGPNEDEPIITCESYTGDGTHSGNKINIGFEPQWVLIKNATTNSQWVIFDSMRGVHSFNSTTAYLEVNDNQPEGAFTGINFNATGFEPRNNGSWQNSPGDQFIYIAIRRPHRRHTDATKVFDVQRQSTTGNPVLSTVLNHVDMTWQRFRSAGSWMMSARMMGSQFLELDDTASLRDDGSGTITYDHNFGVRPYIWGSGVHSTYMFKRTPGFFDFVTYKGDNSSAHRVRHSLGVVPELYIVKCRNDSKAWHTYFGDANKSAVLNGTGIDNSSNKWGGNAPDAYGFYVSNVPQHNETNSSNNTYIAMLFATLPGVSKVGTYTGTGSILNVDCGFSSGSRFVLIKRIDGSGSWYVFDSESGIAQFSNDPYVMTNSANAETTNSNLLIPYGAGFAVWGSSELNVNGNTYLFLAIA
jgi:hypothetical protein